MHLVLSGKGSVLSTAEVIVATLGVREFSGPRGTF